MHATIGTWLPVWGRFSRVVPFSPQVTRLTKDNLENQDNDQHPAPKSHPGGWKSGGEFVSAEATRLVEMYSADRNTTFAVIAPRGWVMFSHTLRPSFANELSVLTHEQYFCDAYTCCRLSSLCSRSQFPYWKHWTRLTRTRTYDNHKKCWDWHCPVRRITSVL